MQRRNRDFRPLGFCWFLLETRKSELLKTITVKNSQMSASNPLQKTGWSWLISYTDSILVDNVEVKFAQFQYQRPFRKYARLLDASQLHSSLSWRNSWLRIISTFGKPLLKPRLLALRFWNLRTSPTWTWKAAEGAAYLRGVAWCCGGWRRRQWREVVERCWKRQFVFPFTMCHFPCHLKLLESTFPIETIDSART